MAGGLLDFPRHASFAAVKLVLWWEEEFIAAYRHSSGFMQHTTSAGDDNQANSGACGGIVKSSDPAKFVGLITKSADQLLGNQIFMFTTAKQLCLSSWVNYKKHSRTYLFHVSQFIYSNEKNVIKQM